MPRTVWPVFFFIHKRLYHLHACPIRKWSTRPRPPSLKGKANTQTLVIIRINYRKRGKAYLSQYCSWVSSSSAPVHLPNIIRRNDIANIIPTSSCFSEGNSVSFPEKCSVWEGLRFEVLCVRSPGVKGICAKGLLCTMRIRLVARAWGF